MALTLSLIHILLRQWTFQRPNEIHMEMYKTLNTIRGIAEWFRDRSTLVYLSGLEFDEE